MTDPRFKPGDQADASETPLSAMAEIVKLLEFEDARLRTVLESIGEMSKWTDGERAIQTARDAFEKAN